MFSKPVNETPEARLATLQVQLAAAEQALTTARTNRATLEVLRDGLTPIDYREVERADSALLAARSNVAQLRRDVGDAQRAVDLERTRPAREKSNKQLQALAREFEAQLKRTAVEAKALAEIYDRLPASAIDSVAPGTLQILNFNMPRATEFLCGDTLLQVVGVIRASGHRIVSGERGPELGLTIGELAVQLGRRIA
jgi:hypothetical protein